jgi:O-antigen/teichoic acid export membrane protein
VSIAVVINGFPRVFRVYLEKNLRFRETTILHLARNVLDMVSSVVFITLGYGIPGFVYGTILSSAAYTVLNVLAAYLKTDLRIHLCLDLKEALPFIRFGIFISLRQIVTFAASHLDEVLIGKLLAPEVLGYYAFGKDFLNRPLTLISQSFTQVLYAFFSKIKHDLDRLRNTYNKAVYSVAVISFPVFFGIAATAELFVPLLFGKAWIPSIMAIRVFALAGIFKVVTANISSSLLYTINKPDTLMYIDLYSYIAYFALMLPLARFGLPYVLAVFLLQTIVRTIVLQLVIGKNLRYGFGAFLRKVQSSFVSAAIMALLVFGLQLLQAGLSAPLRFVAAVVLGSASYITALWIIDRNAFRLFGKLLINRRIEG